MEIPLFQRLFFSARAPNSLNSSSNLQVRYHSTPWSRRVGQGRVEAEVKKPVVVEQPHLWRSKSKIDETQPALEQSVSRRNQTRAEPQFLGKQPRSRWNLSESECSSEKQPGTSGESGQSVNGAHKRTNKQARPLNNNNKNPPKGF